MKRLTLLLPLILLACSFSSFPLIPLPGPTRPPTLTASPVPPTVTDTPPAPPTYTLTPTMIGARPTATETNTPLATGTILYLTPPTETLVPPTSIPTSSLAGTGFESIALTNIQIYWGACDPNAVTITAQVSSPGQVFDVVLFTRIRDKASGNSTGWDQGTSMDNKGDGTFSWVIDGRKLGQYANSWVMYQLVGTDQNGVEIARSPIYNDDLTLSSCP